jgi:5-methylcytosine-specific restriction endonuclease McrBC regulatory subunit McrC
MNESFCFLFPTDLLFEGFIGGFIKEVVSDFGGKVTLQKSNMSLIEKIIYKDKTSGAAFTMRHDILVEYNGKVYILDTKYKEITRFEDNPNYTETINSEVSQNDLYQVLEYARKRNVEDVYLLYPMYRYEVIEKDFPIALSESPHGNIKVHFIRMPFVFEEDVENTKRQLVDVVKGIF